MTTQSKIRIGLARLGMRPADRSEGAVRISVNVGTEKFPETVTVWATHRPKMLPSETQLISSLFQAYACHASSVGVQVGAMYDTWKLLVVPVGKSKHTLPDVNEGGLTFQKAREIAQALLAEINI